MTTPPTHNPERGEVALTLAGTSIVLRPTFQAIAEIEQMTGAAALVLLKQIGGQTIKTSDQVAILYAGHRASETKPKLSVGQIGELLMDSGYTSEVINALSDFMLQILKGRGADEGTQNPT